MKLSAIAAAIAAAGVAEVAAAPLRVIMVSSGIQESPTHIRWGHAAAQTSSMPKITSVEGHKNRPCSGRMGRFRQKSVEISNAFRHALGWPLIEAHVRPQGSRPHHPLSILPINPGEIQFLTPDEPVDSKFWKVKNVEHSVVIPVPQRGGLGLPGYHHRFHHGGDRPFLDRLHFSLMNLGIWEGRAVAFVLGCGIGVLLRMFWVLALVAYRVVKRRSANEDEDEYTHIIMFEEAEPSPVPPAYLVDEKVPVKEETKAAEAK